jgi:hypothetical protein
MKYVQALNNNRKIILYQQMTNVLLSRMARIPEAEALLHHCAASVVSVRLKNSTLIYFETTSPTHRSSQIREATMCQKRTHHLPPHLNSISPWKNGSLKGDCAGKVKVRVPFHQVF